MKIKTPCSLNSLASWLAISFSATGLTNGTLRAQIRPQLKGYKKEASLFRSAEKAICVQIDSEDVADRICRRRVFSASNQYRFCRSTLQYRKLVILAFPCHALYKVWFLPRTACTFTFLKAGNTLRWGRKSSSAGDGWWSPARRMAFRVRITLPIGF